MVITRLINITASIKPGKFSDNFVNCTGINGFFNNLTWSTEKLVNQILNCL